MAEEQVVAGQVESEREAQPHESAETGLMDLLAYIYLQNGLPDKAAVLMAARDVLEPDDPKALLALALAQVRSAKPERALATLERLAMLGAVNAPFHLVRAQALQSLQRNDEAASAMRAFVAMRPQNDDPDLQSSAATRST